jgi:hypothetical protein
MSWFDHRDGLYTTGDERMRREGLSVVLAVLVLLGAGSAVATGQPAHGLRVLVDLTFTTALPASPTGYHYREWISDPDHPGARVPALRSMSYEGPGGGQVDTAAPPRCTASDEQLKAMGESACAAESRIGSGTTTLDMDIFGRMTFPVSIYNAPAVDLDVVKSAGRVVALVRNRYHGNGYSNTIPTCLAGGQPPTGCPADQSSIVHSDFTAAPWWAGSGRHRRALVMTPPSCPRAGYWRGRATFRFADGFGESIGTRHPCTRLGLRLRDGRGPLRHRCAAGPVAASLSGRDLSDVARVDFLSDGRRVARDTRAPFRARLPGLRRAGVHRLTARVYAFGALVKAVRARATTCRHTSAG